MYRDLKEFIVSKRKWYCSIWILFANAAEFDMFYDLFTEAINSHPPELDGDKIDDIEDIKKKISEDKNNCSFSILLKSTDWKIRLGVDKSGNRVNYNVCRWSFLLDEFKSSANPSGEQDVFEAYDFLPEECRRKLNLNYIGNYMEL